MNTAASLKSLLAQGNLRAVRKALNLPLVALVAAELAISDPENSGLTVMEVAVLGMEVLKFYLSARGHDTQNLCYRNMLWSSEVWGTEEGFVETKTTGAGRRVEVLPAWVSRLHTLTGRDWAFAWTKFLEKNRVLPPPEPGYTLQDVETGERMSYDVKLRLTREAWSKLNLSRAAEWLGRQEFQSHLPAQFCQLLGEHSARGVLDTWGVECGISKTRLQFLGRWTPKESVDDYARSSRAIVLGIVKEVSERIRAGWRPDESITGLRAKERCSQTSLDTSGFLFGDCQWSQDKERVLEECRKPDIEEENWVPPQAENTESDATLLVVLDPRTLEAGKVHWTKPGGEGSVLETGCGKTVGRDIKVWESHAWPQGEGVEFDFSTTCSGYRCRDFFATWSRSSSSSVPVVVRESEEEAELSDSDEEGLVEPSRLPVL